MYNRCPCRDCARPHAPRCVLRTPLPRLRSFGAPDPAPLPCAARPRGDIKGCAKLYQKAAEKAVSSAASPEVQRRLSAGLQV
jgi:hypothetical protein